MGHHHAEEDKQAHPKGAHSHHEAENRHFLCDKEIAEDGTGQIEEGQRYQRIGGGNVNIPEAAFAVHQRGQTPVGHDPQQEGGQQIHQRLQHVSLFAQEITLAQHTVQLDQQGNAQPEGGAPHTAPPFMLQIPEAVEGVEYYMEPVYDFLPETAGSAGRLQTAVIGLSKSEEFHQQHDQHHRPRHQKQADLVENGLPVQLIGPGIIRAVVDQAKIFHSCLIIALFQ